MEETVGECTTETDHLKEKLWEMALNTSKKQIYELKKGLEKYKVIGFGRLLQTILDIHTHMESEDARIIRTTEDLTSARPSGGPAEFEK